MPLVVEFGNKHSCQYSELFATVSHCWQQVAAICQLVGTYLATVPQLVTTILLLFLNEVN